MKPLPTPPPVREAALGLEDSSAAAERGLLGEVGAGCGFHSLEVPLVLSGISLNSVRNRELKVTGKEANETHSDLLHIVWKEQPSSVEVTHFPWLNRLKDCLL